VERKEMIDMLSEKDVRELKIKFLSKRAYQRLNSRDKVWVDGWVACEKLWLKVFDECVVFDFKEVRV
jgi:hypothetical protein